MLLLVVKGIVLWIVYMLIFIAVGSIISIAAIEIDSRYVKTTGMAALGSWIVPMLLFCVLCIAAAIVVIVVWGYSSSNIVKLLIIFLPGTIFGSTSVFMVGPLWGSWRGNS